MKAWMVREHGGADVLKKVDFDLKPDFDDQIELKVEAVGLNHLDLWVRNGVPGHHFPLPMILGCDIAGEVLSTNSQVFTKGTKVVVNSILQGRDLVDPSTGKAHPFGLIGETRHGGLCERVFVSEGNLVNRKSLSSIQAACLPIAYVTAFAMIHHKANLKKDQWILIQAGGSGVGVACIQFAKAIGAKVITTVGSQEKKEKAIQLGADHVINYQQNSFKEEFRKIRKSQGFRGVDVAIDHVGQSTFNESLSALNWGGKLVTCGATSGSEIRIDLKAVFFKSLSILGSTMGKISDLGEIVAMVDQKKITPVIDSTFNFNDLPRAMNKLESRDVFGKVVIDF